ncbi:MAG: hypothetical protein VX433_04090 [Candidatus Thermoplasmatota archaeon]|nr:hypothetical protein [Candidatus Thermoplasmatota archaeon]
MRSVGEGMDWGAHRNRWIELGFDSVAVDALFGVEPDSESVASAEGRLQQANDLIALMDEAPTIMNEIPKVMQAHLLNHPEDVDEIREKYMTHLRDMAPWSIAADRARDLWSMEGRSVELQAWMRRLNTLDRGGGEEVIALVRAIEEVAPRDSIRRCIEVLEAKQRDREAVLQNLVDILQQKGWAIQFSEGATLIQRFEEANQWLHLEDRLEDIESQVGTFVVRRESRARDMMKHVQEIRRNPAIDAVIQLEQEVAKEILDISKQDTIIQEIVLEWRELGLLLPYNNPLSVADFASIDGKLEQLQKDWQSALDSSQRLRDLGVPLNLDIIDRGDCSNELAKEIQAWELRIAQVSQEAKTQITEWESLGLDVRGFAGLDARALDIEVRRSKVLGSLAEGLLGSLKSLDMSMDKKRIDAVHVAIQNEWLKEDGLKAISTEIDRLNRRQASHRTMLISRAKDLNMDADESEKWSLSEFEARIAKAEVTRNRQKERKDAEKQRMAILEQKRLEERVRPILEKTEKELVPVEEKEDNSWIERIAADGRIFYYNEQTKESTWEIPSRLSVTESVVVEPENVIENDVKVDKVIQENELKESIESPKANEDMDKKKLPDVENFHWKKDGLYLRERLGIDGRDSLIVEASRSRDLRIQRLLRLIPLIESKFDHNEWTGLVKGLDPLLDSIDQWIRVRSEHRNCWKSDGGLIQQMDRLLDVLDDVPGPGIQLPIGFDNEKLPETAEDIVAEIDILAKQKIRIAGGIRAA